MNRSDVLIEPACAKAIVPHSYQLRLLLIQYILLKADQTLRAIGVWCHGRGDIIWRQETESGSLENNE